MDGQGTNDKDWEQELAHAGSSWSSALVGNLPEPARTIVSLRAYAGSTVAEIAELLNLDEEVVADVLAAAVRQLRQHLGRPS